MENHNLDHLGTTAMTEEVFPQEGMHEMLSKKEAPLIKSVTKGNGVGVFPGAGRAALMF